MRAVRSGLCVNTLKYQIGGRVKQYIMTERKRERDNDTESGRQGTTFVWIFRFTSNIYLTLLVSILILIC